VPGQLAESTQQSHRRGAPRDLVRQYARAVQRDVMWPTALRRALEMTVTFVVEHDLYRSAPVRRLLEWGYARREFEVAKTTQ
jgi:hypothetical protein